MILGRRGGEGGDFSLDYNSKFDYPDIIFEVLLCPAIPEDSIFKLQHKHAYAPPCYFCLGVEVK